MNIRRFMRRNLLGYLIPNVLINTGLPYFVFKNMDGVYLFEGTQNLARFLLPMSLFLPFLITFDILRKTFDLFDKGHPGIRIPERLSRNKNKFIVRQAGINAGCSIVLVLVFLFALYLAFPAHYGFNGIALAVLTGFTAGMYSVIFAWLPVKKFIKKY